MLAIAQGCPRLRKLNLSHCESVSVNAAHHLLRRTPRLTELRMDAYLQLTDHHKKKVLEQRYGGGTRMYLHNDDESRFGELWNDTVDDGDYEVK